jgi:hypothetical protein
MIRLGALEAWQEAVMDVDAPSVHGRGEVVRQDLHISRQDGELGPGMLHDFEKTRLLRFLPVGAILCLAAWSRLPRSSAAVASLHGISAYSYLRKVVVPVLRPTLLLSVVVISLLAAADVSTTLLIQPPGAATFPARIFAVMDNASERLVAALCLLYVGASVLVLALGLIIYRVPFARVANA